MLVQEGLATHSQNRGFTVPELSQRDLADINEARVPMEALALELGRARCTPARIAAIERLKDELVASFRAEDVNRLALLDLEFHAAVWESAENPWLAAALRRILGPYFTFAGIQDIRSPHLTEQLLESQHRLFLDFLKGECDRTALECVQFHLEITRKR